MKTTKTPESALVTSAMHGFPCPDQDFRENFRRAANEFAECYREDLRADCIEMGTRAAIQVCAEGYQRGIERNGGPLSKAQLDDFRGYCRGMVAIAVRTMARQWNENTP